MGKTFRVRVREENWGWVEVDAESPEAAEEAVRRSIDAENNYGFWQRCKDQDSETDIVVSEA